LLLKMYMLTKISKLQPLVAIVLKQLYPEKDLQIAQ